jgi:predicted nuclease of predicted toxin-antitoxin system
VKWLIDEMLPPTTATELIALGHDAVSVHDVGLAGTADELVLARAIADGRVVATENFADFARLVDQCQARAEPCVPVVFVRKRDLPKRGAMALNLARRLHRWAEINPDPYPGVHWPR